jgi:myo-inositol 2-dehydrogenase / D-chiro-inositol 1-dehydrogenase
MPRISRRQALATTGLALAASAVSWPVTAQTVAPVKSPNARWRIGAIGMRYQGTVITREATTFGDVIAICDVDRHVRDQARASFGSTATLFEDYRELLARSDIDVVMIGAPDHWHVKMAVDACRAGKDVYVEKPVTLTIDEGKLLQKVVAETGRVVQVGTWQRSDQRFRLAAEMIQAGRLGTLEKVTVVLGKNPTGGPFETDSPPKNLNWDRWLGPAPLVPYTPERCHYTFRFWYDYAGGEMTDTGAHHIDIAQWALGRQLTGPVEIISDAKLPQVANGYSVPTDFKVTFRYADGLEMDVLDTGRNGILFEGSAGRLFVNRGSITGKPVEDLAQKPLPRDAYSLYDADNLARPELSGKIDAIKNHIGNFYDCTQSRKTPISDVVSQHRSAATCHLGNIACRLGRTLKWDPEQELFPGDATANAYLRREQRSGYEVV